MAATNDEPTAAELPGPATSIPGHEGHGGGACLKLASTLDRRNEVHWLLHQLNVHYHEADAFRYSLNSFIRVMTEVPQLITWSCETMRRGRLTTRITRLPSAGVEPARWRLTRG